MLVFELSVAVLRVTCSTSKCLVCPEAWSKLELTGAQLVREKVTEFRATLTSQRALQMVSPAEADGHEAVQNTGKSTDEKKKQGKNDIGHLDSLAIAESCLREREDMLCVVAEAT